MTAENPTKTRRRRIPKKIRKYLPVTITLSILAIGAIVFGGYLLWNTLRPAETYENRESAAADLRQRLAQVNENIPATTVDNDKLSRDENGYMIYTENGVKTSRTGIDVSKWNGEIDWKKVSAAGVEFAMIRIGNRTVNGGNLVLDPCFHDNIKGALEAGIKVGVYFYTQAVTKEEAEEEALFCLENMAGYDVTYPVVFDTERYEGNARANDLDSTLRTEVAKTFMDKIKNSGFVPAIYMNTSWSIMNVNLESLSDYDLWYAYYGDDLYYPYRFTIWQYTDKGEIPGIKGHVDLNISFAEY